MKTLNLRRTLLLTVFCALCMTFAAAVTAVAQAGRGGISDLVTDTSGAVIPGAAGAGSADRRGCGLRLFAHAMDKPRTSKAEVRATPLPLAGYE